MYRRLLSLAVLALCLAVLNPLAGAQVPKYRVPEGAPEPHLDYHGVVAGKSTLAEVRELLGEPIFAARWYNYKIYYPAEGRPEGMVDVVHLNGDSPDSTVGSIEAASIPESHANEAAIRAQVGKPEYELRMATWKLLDYSEQGLRFALDPEGNTIGVVYVAHETYRRVPEGERDLMDLTHLRQGPQPAPAAPADLRGLEVGTSEAILSPQEQDWLPRPFRVVTELKARTAVFRADDLTVALVGNDLFGMGWQDVMVIREAARELGVDHVIFGMSHNHAAGDTIGVYGHYPAEYIAHIQQRTIEGIEAALGNMQPVWELRVASKELPMDGARVMHLIRNARNPGLMDPTINLIQALGEDGAPLATIVNFACHVEGIGASGEITADFPGYMADAIQARGGGQAVFLTGAVGGMISGDNPERTHESAEEMGLRLAEIVGELEAMAQPVETFNFTVDQRRLEIPVTTGSWKPMLEAGLRPVNRGRIITDMIYFELGTAQFITLPGELFPEVAFEILEKMEGFPRVLVGLGNDELGYLLPLYDFRDDYYEETASPGPAGGPQVRDMALRMLEANQ